MPEQLTPDFILQNALEIPDPQQRAAYLVESCGDDQALREELESLVSAHFEAHGFMETLAERTWEDAPTEKVGDQIGPYKLLRKIGEGGMGYVYAAEQRAPVRRKVAVKVIKPGMDSREVLARFDAERQALSLMDHPNIARVLDAGEMEGGRPYFVMDLVSGHPITDYCDRNRLGLEDRLELFLQVCQGIQHAHQKAIIHRDIKPSNVVVTVNANQPIPKVIDFGIAKAMGAELTMKTYFTFAGQIVGTPAYMSPEQAGADPADVDTRSDIYSLGVLLNELLTGQTPIGAEDLKGAGLEQMLRMIREHDTVKPSTLLTRLDRDAADAITSKRNTGMARLFHYLKGDLDWLVLKALEKDRSRRYETANALANDVRSFLRNESILATPPTLRYRLGKVMRRHKGPIIAGSTVTLALIGGLVASLSQANRASHEAKRARAAEEAALENLGIAIEERQNAKRAQGFAESERSKTESAIRKVEEERKKAEKTLEQLRDSQRREAQGEIARSDLDRRVTELLEFLRSEEMRIELQKKDLNGLDVVRSINDTINRKFPVASKAKNFLAQDYDMALKLGDHAINSLESSLTTAQSNFNSALRSYDALERSEPIELGRIHLSLAEIARMRGRYRDALNHLDQAMESIGPLLGAQFEADVLRIRILHSRALSASRVGDANLARQATREAIAHAREIPENSPDFAACQLTAYALSLEFSRALPENTLKAFEEVLAAQAELQDPPPEQYLAAASVRLRLGVQNTLARAAEATPPDLAVTRAAEDIRRQAAGSIDRPTRLLELTSELMAGDTLGQMELTSNALRHYQRCLDRSAALLRLDGEVAAPLEARFRAGVAMARIYAAANEHAKRLHSLETAYDGLLEARRRNLDTSHYDSHSPRLLERMVTAAIHRYYVAMGSPSALEENAFYSDPVDYFQVRRGRQEILEEQVRYRKKYPHRIFKVSEILELQGNARDGFQVRVAVDYWLADPRQENTINLNIPDGDFAQEIRLAFDESDRLRIAAIKRIQLE